MGIKKIKYILIGFVLFLAILTIPLKISAAETQTSYLPVRVGIGDQNFQNYNYQKITLFGTSEVELFDKQTHTLVTTFPADFPIEINLNENKFEIIYNDNLISSTDSLVFECKTGFLGVQNLKRKGKQALYRHALEVVVNPKTKNTFYLVNELDIQDYLKGVVPNEMPVHFGLEALKAQAVAARNYVLSPRTRIVNEYDVVDSVSSQVYFGANTEESLSNRAVDETDGIVALYNWNLILAQYSSTAGGYTESFANAFSDSTGKKFPASPKPYLVAKADLLTQLPLKTEEQVKEFYMNSPESYDIRSPYYRWQKCWEKDEFQEMLAKTLVSQSKTGFVYPKLEKSEDFGEFLALKPRKRGDSGKLMEIEIVTSKGSYIVQKELVIRRTFQKDNISLPSANVVFEPVLDEKNNLVQIIAYGGGFGHGVGMSQYGAGFMAKELKMPYDKILKHYYTGITLGTIPKIISAYPTQQNATQEFYLNHRSANLVLDNKFNLSKINLTINGQTVTIPLEQSFSPFKEPLKIDISYYIKKGKNVITFSYPLDEGSMKAARLYIEATNPDANKFGF